MSNLPERPSAILWDLDGTLVESEAMSGEAMRRVLKSGQGIEINDEDVSFIIGRSWVDIHGQLLSRYPRMAWSMDELIAQVAHERETIIDVEGLLVLPGAIEAIARFEALPMAIVTGSSRAEADQALGAMGLSQSFSVVLAAEDVPTSKPSPEGYLMAANELRVDPRECVVFEDSSAGIGAGRAAGCQVVAVSVGNYAKQDQSAAHRVISTLKEASWDFLAELFV